LEVVNAIECNNCKFDMGNIFYELVWSKCIYHTL
jgi:hypothetical protein